MIRVLLVRVDEIEAHDLWNKALQEEKDGFVKERTVEESEVRNSFGGENARTADLKTLANAKNMFARNRSAVDVFRETGWFVGA